LDHPRDVVPGRRPEDDRCPQVVAGDVILHVVEVDAEADLRGEVDHHGSVAQQRNQRRAIADVGFDDPRS